MKLVSGLELLQWFILWLYSPEPKFFIENRELSYVLIILCACMNGNFNSLMSCDWD
jgi:hypothetical protein